MAKDKKVYKIILKIMSVPLSVIIMAMIGLLALAAVYCIPTGGMSENMARSADIIEREGTYPNLMMNESSKLDNYTDSIMLMTATYNNAGNNPFYSAMKSGVYTSDEKMTPDETLVYIYKNNGTAYHDSAYSRYWHGYLVFLKPLLFFFNYGKIRYILMFTQLILFSVLLFKLMERDKRLIIPVVLAWLFMNPVATMMSLQFNSVVVITFTAMILMLLLFKRWEKKGIFRWILFFISIGSTTSFLDLLTFPLVSLGLPLMLFFALNEAQRKKSDLIRSLLNLLFLTFGWIFGYGAMWAMKWGIGGLITGDNIFKNAISQLLFRTSSEDGNINISFFDVIAKEGSMIYKWMWLAVAVVLAIIFVILLIKNRKFEYRMFVISIIIGLLPFGWYFVTKNHSYIHTSFTYRELTITVFSAATFVMLHKLFGKEHGNIHLK